MSTLALIGLIAATLFSAERGGVSVELASETERIDPGRSVFVTVKIVTARGVSVPLPDLRTRVRGFSLAQRCPPLWDGQVNAALGIDTKVDPTASLAHDFDGHAVDLVCPCVNHNTSSLASSGQMLVESAFVHSNGKVRHLSGLTGLIRQRLSDVR